MSNLYKVGRGSDTRSWRNGLIARRTAGIAVSAGELDERQAEELHKTRHKLRDALQSLQALRQENQELRLRLASVQDEGAARDEL